jgi:hypothetical protein
MVRQLGANGRSELMEGWEFRGNGRPDQCMKQACVEQDRFAKGVFHLASEGEAVGGAVAD